MGKTLRQIREAAGLSLEEAASRIKEIESSAPRTYMGLWHIEQRGTDRLLLIRAMAKVYKVSALEVEESALDIFTNRVKNEAESLDADLQTA